MLRISGSERGKNCASSVSMGTQAHHALGSGGGWGGGDTNCVLLKVTSYLGEIP